MKKRSEIVGYPGASDATGMTVNTLYTYVHRKQIPHIRIGCWLIRFDVSELEAWLDEKRCDAVEEGRKAVSTKRCCRRLLNTTRAKDFG